MPQHSPTVELKITTSPRNSENTMFVICVFSSTGDAPPSGLCPNIIFSVTNGDHPFSPPLHPAHSPHSLCHFCLHHSPFLPSDQLKVYLSGVFLFLFLFFVCPPPLIDCKLPEGKGLHVLVTAVSPTPRTVDYLTSICKMATAGKGGRYRKWTLQINC